MARYALNTSNLIGLCDASGTTGANGIIYSDHRLRGVLDGLHHSTWR